mgnify:CR=1 FL=1
MKNQRKVLVVSLDESVHGCFSAVKQLADGLHLGTIHQARNYDQIIGSIQQGTPDLIICEVGLKCETDGIALMRTIARVYPIPVFFILNENQPYLVEQTKEFTTVGVLLKPLNLVQLKLSLKLSFNKIGLLI